MEQLDYSLGAYKSSPSHILVAVGTRREIARVHHEEDLMYIVKACNAHRRLVVALEEIVKNDPYNQSSAGIIAREALAAAKGE